MKWVRGYLSIILILSLIGCATSIDLSKTKTVPQNESVVFGRIKVISKGNEVDWSTFWSTFHVTTFTFNVSILRDMSSEGGSYMLKNDGTFYWHLRPGNYTVAEFEWRRSGGLLYTGIESLRGRIFANFKVAEGGFLNYIGTLTMIFEDKVNRYFMGVGDDFDQAFKVFGEKFPNLKGEAVKNLMQFEKGP
jgi:hypothetical protein